MSSASTIPTNPSEAPAGRLPTELSDDDDDHRPQWLVVASAGVLWGIPVEQVREVVRPAGLRPVPGSPVIQAGIVNVRGAIVTALDLQALRTGERAVTPGSIVLLQHGARPIGLVVDTVHDVRGATPESPDAPAGVTVLDAVALCARYLHSAEERAR
ncbi:chemotaxis protein CheW [Gemmatimonas phototrophica]|uniref:chemotaxis protein CheW n=1 Tax=Gemmatimonas phototrophica TaxID=1379270 RepID=UPI0009467168